MKKIVLFTLIASLGLGCMWDRGYYPPQRPDHSPTGSVSAVIVGIPRSYMGDNVGAYMDTWMMYEILTNVTDDVTCLIGPEASRKRVLTALENACTNELAVFFFSGHGGQEYTFSDKTEVDHKNEYMVLESTTILDDEIWNAISKSTNRVMLIFNCCKSETMYRDAYNGFNLDKYITPTTRAAQVNDDEIGFKMLCWSGCQEDKYSFTGYDGGIFTRAIYRAYNALGRDCRYSTLWNIIQYSSDATKYQKPRKSNAGGFDETMQAFR